MPSSDTAIVSPADLSVSNIIASTMENRRRCVPHCNEKRDFQDNNPEKTKEDFYKNYDPLIGVSTAAILAVIMFYFVAKWLFNCLERKIQIMRYKRQKNRTQHDASNANGHLNL